MKSSLLSLLSIAFIFLTGCDGRPPELERTAFLLKEGMTKNEVKAIFADHPILFETNEVERVEDDAKIFGTNRTCSSWIAFDHKGKWNSLMEWCVVYFDTNDVIIAYQYKLID